MTKEKLHTCKICGEEKTFEDMVKEKRNKSGATSVCKECRNKQDAANGNLYRASFRKYKYRANRSCFLTEKTVKRMMEATHCTYCGCELSHIPNALSQATMDHVYNLGGYGGENLDINIMPACRQCNASKNRSHIYDFYQSSEKFTPELWANFVRKHGELFIGRDLTDAEASAWSEGLRDEAEQLARNAAKTKGGVAQ